jgi:hypothetical protein
VLKLFYQKYYFLIKLKLNDISEIYFQENQHIDILSFNCRTRLKYKKIKKFFVLTIFLIFKKMAFFSFFWQKSYISAKTYLNKRYYLAKAKLQKKTKKRVFLKMSWKFVVVSICFVKLA